MSKASKRNLEKITPVNGVKSVEQPQAAKYDSAGRKTGQVASYFSWWMAVAQDGTGTVLNYLQVLYEVEGNGELQLIGEARSGRLIHSVLKAEKKATGIISVTLEDNTNVTLYPNLQITPGSVEIQHYWIKDQESGKELLFPDLEFDETGKVGNHNREELFEIHGQLIDNRETTVPVAEIIALDEQRAGNCLAVGNYGRYLLHNPTNYAEVQAYRAREKRAI
ncbi:hypothetical protein IJJ18_02420 [Candidatus Saccharibacteria bacterium]|nr:hypothetical protein [Candidatus Saccharibacteria bacterium]